MRVVIKGMNYTEVTTRNKDDFNETVQHWVLKKIRKKEQCGVWYNGKQIATYETMAENVSPNPLDPENPKSSFLNNPVEEQKGATK